MGKYYRISEAALLLGVCSKTIRRWDAAGKIECKRTVGGHRRISILEINRILNRLYKNQDLQEDTATAIYCRVSSHEQKKKGDLTRQIEAAQLFCRKKQITPRYIFQDIGSGLNTRRTGLKKLCALIEQKQISQVILTYPDRLTRFGFDYLSAYFKSHGASIRAIHKKPTCSMQEELIQDLIAIITSFPGRVHGMRSHRNGTKQKNCVRNAHC
jgi:putative resolvase